MLFITPTAIRRVQKCSVAGGVEVSLFSAVPLRIAQLNALATIINALQEHTFRGEWIIGRTLLFRLLDSCFLPVRPLSSAGWTRASRREGILAAVKSPKRRECNEC